MLRKDLFLALFCSLFSSIISLHVFLLPSAALFVLAIWPSDSPPPRPHADVEATLGALIRWDRWSENWCLPLNPSKGQASFLLIDPHQGNLQAHLFFNSPLHFNSTSTFLGLKESLQRVSFLQSLIPARSHLPFTRMVSISQHLQRYEIGTPLPSGHSRHHWLPFVLPCSSSPSEASLPPLHLTLTHFALIIYEQGLHLLIFIFITSSATCSET